jgi:hypothetical protein
MTGWDVGFVYITGPDGRFSVDSSHVDSEMDFGIATETVLGNSLPVGLDGGIGLVLPEGGVPYAVDLDGPGPEAAADYPFGMADAVQVAFAPLAEVNPLVQPPGCGVGANDDDPFTNVGTIVGYNVYRVADGGARIPPTPTQFGGHWQAYLPFSPSLPNVALTTCRSVGIADPADMPAVSGYRDNDGRPYSGDELMIFHDGVLNGDGTPRPSGAPLAPGVEYWYAFQPVIGQNPGETIADLEGVVLTSLGESRISVIATRDGPATGADLDRDGTPDFYSPQAVLGIGGLGLTNKSAPALSTPVLGALDARDCSSACPPLSCLRIDARPPSTCAGEAVELTGVASGGAGSLWFEWDLDGDTVADVTGNPAVVPLGAGLHAIDVTVTDRCTPVAQACTSSTSVQVSASSIGEVSGASDGPLLVRDRGDALEISSRPAALAYNVYGAALGRWVPGPTPGLACLLTSWTDLGGGRLLLAVPLASNSWCVVTASDLTCEGPAGLDTLSRERTLADNFLLCGPLP